jgi:hypothetical protein
VNTIAGQYTVAHDSLVVDHNSCLLLILEQLGDALAKTHVDSELQNVFIKDDLQVTAIAVSVSSCPDGWLRMALRCVARAC